MANIVRDITDREVDFAQWYTDVCKKADLVDYSKNKGSMIIRPYGYAIWENMVSILDKEFKRLGHQNVQMPMLIPESLLNIEKEHVEGFAPEVAWVTYGGENKLEERMCIRPTSETLFCDHFKKIVNSYRDLPILYNQWCTIVRWEKTTRPFLRSREILWQEGHTLHATAKEAKNETLQMLKVYEDFQKYYLALPVIVGKKTEKEKFAGAEDTYTIEAMMWDGVALQNGTSHYFGQHFAKAFDIKFLDKDNTRYISILYRDILPQFDITSELDKKISQTYIELIDSDFFQKKLLEDLLGKSPYDVLSQEDIVKKIYNRLK